MPDFFETRDGHMDDPIDGGGMSNEQRGMSNERGGISSVDPTERDGFFAAKPSLREQREAQRQSDRENIDHGIDTWEAPSGGGGGGLGIKPLQVIRTRPSGYTATIPSDPHVWVTWGTIASVVPNNIESPIELPPDARRYIYLEVIPKTIEGDVFSAVEPNVDSAEIKVTEDENKPEQPSLDTETGKPPEKLLYVLARVDTSSEGTVTRIENTGVGSIGLYIYSQTAAVVPADGESDGGIVTVMNYAFYRPA